VHRLPRTVAAALAVGVLLALLPSTPAAAAQPRKADRAAAWEATQLSSGRIRNVQFDFTDWGLTVDTYFALVAADNRPRQARTVIRTVSATVRKYVSFDGDFFAGAVAKTLLARRVAGLDPSIEGASLDLRRKLQNLVAPSGRAKDSGDSDFSNTIGQSFAVLALARSGGVPPRVVDYLAKQQCRSGGFRLDMRDQRCRRGPVEVDATAYALQALVRARAQGRELPRGAVRDAAAFLLGRQSDNGSFGGSGPTAGPNTNSTGLAAQALDAVGRDKAAANAARWIAGLQLTGRNTRGTPARRDLGAVAYDRADFRLARDEGITRNKRDTWRRSTPQAVAGFAPRSLGSLSAS